MKNRMRWIPAVLAAAVLMCACSRRNDLPSEAETEDRATQVETSDTERNNDNNDGILDDAEDLVSDAVDEGQDIVSDVIDGGEDRTGDTDRETSTRTESETAGRSESRR